MGPKQRGISFAAVFQGSEEEERSQWQHRHGLKGLWAEGEAGNPHPAISVTWNYFRNNTERAVETWWQWLAKSCEMVPEKELKVTGGLQWDEEVVILIKSWMSLKGLSGSGFSLSTSFYQWHRSPLTQWNKHSTKLHVLLSCWATHRHCYKTRTVAWQQGWSHHCVTAGKQRAATWAVAWHFRWHLITSRSKDRIRGERPTPTPYLRTELEINSKGVRTEVVMGAQHLC